MHCDETHKRPSSPDFRGEIELRTASLIILGAPLGYLLLTAYLVNKVRPVPITQLPQLSTVDERVLESVAA